MQAPKLTRALRERPFAYLWLGQTASRIGDAVYLVALAWWVLERTGSATAMGAVLVCEVAPTLVLLLVGGVAVDRWPRLRLMVASDAIRGLLLVILAVLAAAGALELWHIFVAAILFGSVTAFFYPAYAAAIPDVTPPEALPSANALTQLSSRFSGILGPSVGAVVVAGAGFTGAFALDAATFLASAVAVALAARHATSLPHGEREESALAQLREGLVTVARTPWLWVTIAVAALSTVTLAGPLEAALPFLVRDELGGSVETFGVLGSLSAIGAIVAAVWLGRAERLRRRGWLMYGAWAASAVMVALMGLPVGLVAVAVAMFMCGAALAVLGLVWTNTLQELVPRELRGRVASIDLLGSSALLPIGFAVTGVVTDLVGASMVFVWGGLISLVIIAAGLLHPGVRHLD